MANFFHRSVVRRVALLCLFLAGYFNISSVFCDEFPTDEQRALYGQFTNVTQWHPGFTSPYSGANSLDSGNQHESTNDLTLFAGVRLWSGSEFWLNPEIDEGFGLSNTLGVAGYPSGEAYKVGRHHPYFRLPRAFLRQVFNLGSSEQSVSAAVNQLASTQSSDNVILTIGKFSVVDIFDTNRYAHDPRADFLNWSVVDAGAFDYAADSWGYTYGASAEWTQSNRTLRGGVFALSEIPNSELLQNDFHQYELVAEFEQRYQWSEHSGKVKLLGFVNRGYMAKYADAVQLGQQTGMTPGVSQVRHFASRAGIAINMEQELRPGLGIFARASVNDGTKESFEFTEINESISGGLSLQGEMWGRHDDVAGAAAVINGISTQARRYFAAGGMGILIGDGQLPHYGTEKILETYYKLPLSKSLALSADYQYIVNPAYNRDRGPVSILGLRIHAEF